MPVRQYLDLTTAHLTQLEMESVSCGFGEYPGTTPIVREHPYGAWMHVDPEGPGDLDPMFVAGCPNVVAVLAVALAEDCDWVNLDRDAEVHEGLPTFDWEG